jgi:multiple sugar transport system substrate-binding protein
MFKFPPKFIVCLLLISMLLVTIGCSHNSNEENNRLVDQPTAADMNKDPIVLRITWKSYSGRGEAIGKIVQAFNDKKVIDYEIVLADGDEDRDHIEALLAADNQVDLYMLPYRYVQYFGERDQLLNLTEDFIQEKDLFYEQLWSLGAVKGQMYGIPWLGHSIALIYNRDLLERSDIDPAQIDSLGGLVSALVQVEERTSAKGIGLVGAHHHDISWMVNQFINGFDGSLVNSDGTEVMINSDAAIAALDFYKNTLGRFAQEGWTNDSGVEVMNHFREGKVAFEMQGIWGVTDIWKNGRPFEVGVIPLTDITLKADIGPLMVAASAHIDENKRKAAIQFIQYLISAEGQGKVLDGEYIIEQDAYYPFRTPVRKDAVNHKWFEANPELKPFLLGFGDPSIDVPTPKWESIKNDLYEEGLHRVMTGDLGIEEFLQRIETNGNRILLEP